LRNTLTSIMHRGQAGFTLVELMVASVILGMSLTAAMTMLSVGSGIESEDGLRRQAKTIVSRKMEQPIYQNFTLPIVAGDTLTNNFLVTSTGTPVSAKLSVSVKPDSAIWTDGDNINGTVIVPFQTVVVKLEWTFADKTEYFTLQKSIAQ
jgi:prepilin-type N-terminal cleavage/methylation domain-containing protein